jgi:hypothetical protein
LPFHYAITPCQNIAFHYAAITAITPLILRHASHYIISHYMPLYYYYIVLILHYYYYDTLLRHYAISHYYAIITPLLMMIRHWPLLADYAIIDYAITLLLIIAIDIIDIYINIITY